MLGISRTPVRQALHKLQTRGLLRQAPGRGLLVAELDRQQVVELYAMRELLEGAAARLAAQHAGPSDIVAMRRAHAGVSQGRTRRAQSGSHQSPVPRDDP